MTILTIKPYVLSSKKGLLYVATANRANSLAFLTVRFYRHFFEAFDYVEHEIHLYLMRGYPEHRNRLRV